MSIVRCCRVRTTFAMRNAHLVKHCIAQYRYVVRIYSTVVPVVQYVRTYCTAICVQYVQYRYVRTGKPGSQGGGRTDHSARQFHFTSLHLPPTVQYCTVPVPVRTGIYSIQYCTGMTGRLDTARLHGCSGVQSWVVDTSPAVGSVRKSESVKERLNG